MKPHAKTWLTDFWLLSPVAPWLLAFAITTALTALLVGLEWLGYSSIFGFWS